VAHRQVCALERARSGGDKALARCAPRGAAASPGSA